MFAEELRRAVQVCQQERLPELSEAVWKGYAAGAIGEDEAQALAEAIQARKAIPATTVARRFSGARPRSPQSLERRRSWSTGGWAPPHILARFTPGEAAALSVVVAEVAARGACEMPIGAIAARAGVCGTVVRRALRNARALGLLHVEERRIRYDRNMPNRVTVVSAELRLWMRTRARAERRGGGCISVLPTTNHILSSSARSAARSWKTGTFGEVGRKVWANRTKVEPAVYRGKSH